MRRAIPLSISSLICLFFLSIAPAGVSSQTPAAAVDASKLPDIEGIHLGMSVEQASAIMKTLFPPGTHTLTATASKFMNTSDKPWITSMTGSLSNGCTGCSEQVFVRFSIPPNAQQVISIQRTIVFEAGKQPTMDATMAGLRQKYGQETSKSVPDPVQSLAWFFNEQGHQLPASPQFQPGCAGGVLRPPPGGDAGHPNPVGFVVATNPVTPSVIAAMMRDPCRSNVYLRVQLSPTGPALVHILDMYMSENALDTRDMIAAQQYLDGVAAGQKQQQLKKAQQQGAPTL